MRRKRMAYIIIIAFAVSMLDFIKFPGVIADGPGDPYDWPVLAGDSLIWEHQQDGVGVTYEKWVLNYRDWTEISPGNFSETLWFDVYQWNSFMGWERVPYLIYSDSEPAMICAANLTYQYWDHTGYGDYVWGYPYAFLNGLSPQLNAFFLPRHYATFQTYEDWGWVNESYYLSWGALMPPEFNTSIQDNTLVVYNTSQSNAVVQYFNYTIFNQGTYAHAGGLMKDCATFFPNGTIYERWLLRRMIDSTGNTLYSYDEISNNPTLTWGVKKGDKLIWSIDTNYQKWEVAGFGKSGSTSELLYVNSFTWNSDHYDPSSVDYDYPAELPQPALSANCTWQYFDLQGNASHPMWGYPYGFGAENFVMGSIQVLPLQNGAVNMSWFDQAYRETMIMSLGIVPGYISTTINGLTYTVRNTTAGVDIYQFNYTSEGVLRYFCARNWEDGTPATEWILARGPGLPGTVPPAPVYTWGVNEGDKIVWMAQSPMSGQTFMKMDITGFADYMDIREIVMGISSQWDPMSQKWIEQSVMSPYYPPDIPQLLIWANLTWQYFDYSGMGDYCWGYPYAFTGGGPNPQMNSWIMPIQGGSVNMSWLDTSYRIARYGGSPPAELSFAIAGLNYTITNTSSGVVTEKYVYNSMGVLTYACMRDWDNSILMEVAMWVGPGFPPASPPPTMLSWGVNPGDEIVWAKGPDPEDMTLTGQMKWNISFFQDLEFAPGISREVIYANATKLNLGTGEWEPFAMNPYMPPDVPQPVVLANTTWQYFDWFMGDLTSYYDYGYPYGFVGYIVPFFNTNPILSYNEMIVPLQGGVVNMTWINNSWAGILLQGTPLPPDLEVSVVSNTIKYTNTTSTKVQFQLSYTTNGILERLFWRDWQDNYMINYTLLSAPGYTPIEDTTPPSITVLSPTPFQVLGNATPGFEVTITDENLDTTWYNLGGTNYTFSGSTGTFDSAAWSAQGNGTVDITFYANDTVGHQSELLLTVRKDVVPPTLSIVAPTGAYSSGLPPAFDLSITEPNRATIWYTLDGGVSNYTASGPTGTINSAAWGACTSGAVTITFYVNDTGGNWAQASVTVNKLGASMVINSPVENAVFNAIAPGYSVTVASQVGVYYSFNGGVTNYTITMSTTPGTYTGNFDSTAWQNLPNGTVTVTFSVVDGSDFWTTINVNILKDIYAPTITINTPSGSYTSCQPPAFSLTVTEGNLGNIWYSLNGGATNFTCGTSGTINANAWRAVNGGGVWITFYSNDSAGNVGTSTVAVFKLVPYLVVGSPTTNGWYSTAPTITVGAMNYQTLGYNLDGVNNYTFTSLTTTINSAAWTARPDGNVIITIFATDSFGNWNVTSITVHKDATLPTVVISLPTAGASFNSTPTFIVGISDANLVRQWYTLNGGTTEYNFVGTSGTINAAAWAALPNGTVIIRFYGADQAGNVQSQVVVVQKGTTTTTGGGTTPTPTPTPTPPEFPWLWFVVGIAAGAGAGLVTGFFVLKGRKPSGRRGKSKSFWTNLPSEAPEKKKY